MGNQLRASITFNYTPLNCLSLPPKVLTIPKGQALPPGTLLRLTLKQGIQEFRFVSQVIERGFSNRAGLILEATLDQPLAGTAIRAEVVDADLFIDDGVGLTERHVRQGLSS